MPIVIRKSCAADANLPPAIGPRRIHPQRHRGEHPLAGYTTIVTDARTAKLLTRGGDGWRHATKGEADKLAAPGEGELTAQDGDTTEGGTQIPEGTTVSTASVPEWAAAVVDGTVAEVTERLEATPPDGYTDEHVQALRDAEDKRRPSDPDGRVGVHEAINAWAASAGEQGTRARKLLR